MIVAPARWVEVEPAPSRYLNVLDGRQTTGESWTLCKKGVPIKVTTDDDIEGTTRGHNHEGRHPKTPGRANCSFGPRNLAYGN